MELWTVASVRRNVMTVAGVGAGEGAGGHLVLTGAEGGQGVILLEEKDIKDFRSTHLVFIQLWPGFCFCKYFAIYGVNFV